MRHAIVRCMAAAAVVVCAVAAIPTAESFNAAAARGFEIDLRRIPTSVSRVLVPVLPNRVNRFAIAALPIDEIVEIPSGFAVRLEAGGIEIVAPESEAWGYLKVTARGRSLTFTLINLVPYERIENGRLDGYEIGSYQALPLKGLASYRVPLGFIRLTKENANAWVSDHYRLRDFQCKLDGSSKFLIIRPEALIKLELMQDLLARDHGVPISKFTIMSGFRTPFYNSRIGNDTIYSRHLYGDAMDIYVDENGDATMDDITGDDKSDRRDALQLLQIAEQVDHSAEWSWLQGGAGVYNANAAHGPYLHIDTRGYLARWGV